MSILESQPLNVFIFNASNDDALACNSTNYTPNRLIQKLETDLAVLPFLFANPHDIVLVDELPSEAYLDTMKGLEFNLPKFITKHDFFSHELFANNISVNALKPWGWSKSIHSLFDDVKPFTSANYKTSPLFLWNDAFRQISSRTFSREVLSEIIEKQHHYIVSEKAIPTKSNNINDINKIIESEHKIIIKSPWSSSGRGVLLLDKDHYNESNRQWILGIIKKQGFVMIEQWFDKKVDFSFLYNVQNGIINLLCISCFETTNRGQFHGSYIHWPKRNDSIGAIPNDVFQSVSDEIIELLSQKGFSDIYEGWFGVDAMIVNENNSLLIHPCLEINCRYTIGHLAYNLRKFVADNDNAILRIGTRDEFKVAKTGRDDLRIADGKIASGIVSITPINNATQFVGWIEIT